ncbi:hypothetical protein ACFE04_027878 [Oxalis oulophora]
MYRYTAKLFKQGFRKVEPDRWEFAHEAFLKGQKHLLKNITRRKSANNVHNLHQPRLQTSTVGPCIDIKKPVTVEQVESLKKEKNVIMQEIVSLRHQQQTNDNHLRMIVDRVHKTEQRQKQLMSFLVKAVRSPSFLNQLVQEQTESNQNVKKSRLPIQDEENLPNASDGQIVRPQSSFNEAAIGVGHQMLEMNASPDGTFVIDNMLPRNSFGTEKHSSQFSERSLSDISPGKPVPPVSCPSTAFFEIQASSYNQIPEMNVKNPVLPNLTQMQGNMPVVNPHLMSPPEVCNIRDQASGTIPIDSSIFPQVSDVDIVLQFLTGSPLDSGAGEMHSGLLDSVVQMNHMNLASENKMC